MLAIASQNCVCVDFRQAGAGALLGYCTSAVVLLNMVPFKVRPACNCHLNIRAYPLLPAGNISKSLAIHHIMAA